MPIFVGLFGFDWTRAPELADALSLAAIVASIAWGFVWL